MYLVKTAVEEQADGIEQAISEALCNLFFCERYE